WGTWTKRQYCLTGGDDTAANNIQFTCSNGAGLMGFGLSWGEWGPWSVRCLSGGICGMKTRVEDSQGIGRKRVSMDLSASTALLLTISCCLWNTEARQPSFMLSVLNGGSWGEWGPASFCSHGFAHGFSLKVGNMDQKTILPHRVEPNQQGGDDTAANNIQFTCSNGAGLIGFGLSWGEWGPWSHQCRSGGICGIRTRVEDKQGIGDDTALN
ncbi:hypothetical protein E2320_005475, partial [Naja naja]